jgi:hypothetical protein
LDSMLVEMKFCNYRYVRIYTYFFMTFFVLIRVSMFPFVIWVNHLYELIEKVCMCLFSKLPLQLIAVKLKTRLNFNIASSLPLLLKCEYLLEVRASIVYKNWNCIWEFSTKKFYFHIFLLLSHSQTKSIHHNI